MTRQGFWGVLKELTDKTDIRKSVSPHMLRHTFATHLLQGGANLMTVKELLGHSNINTTQIYTHLASKNVRDSFYKTAKGPGR
jgi:integrase/recombinase XerD